jgi:hypothetical protein
LFLHYDHRDLGGNIPLGYIVENRVLRRALFDRAATLPSLRLLAPRAVASMEASDGGATVALADGMSLRTRLVAAADGQNSPLRRAAGIRTIEWRYRQTGIVTTVAHERPHRGIAVEHFPPAGPFAILPRPGTGPRSCGPSTPIWRRVRLCPMPNSPPTGPGSRRDRVGRAALSYPLALMGRTLRRPPSRAGRRGGACDPPVARPGLTSASATSPPSPRSSSMRAARSISAIRRSNDTSAGAARTRCCW